MRRVTAAMWTAATLLAALGLGAPAESALIEYSEGHADIGVALEDNGELFLHYHFGAGAVLDGVALGAEEEYEPEDIYVRAADSLKFINAPLNLVGLGAGPGDAWVLPQSNTAGVPFLGIATEEIPLSGFGTTNFKLTGMTGPGQFALWTAGFGFTTYWDTFDGIGADDVLTMGPGNHAHFNYGFTAPGMYYLNILAEQASNPGVFDSGVFAFAVGDDTFPPTDPQEVPEPGSLVLMGLGALGLVGSKFRRRAANAA